MAHLPGGGMRPRVSVLIPTWNREEYLGEAIESVLNQTYQDFEIIVVDDGSTDGTAELVKHYERVRYVWQPHSGISAARNLALEKAQGELIAWLDSDDLYVPMKLIKQVDYMDKHPECCLVFCLPVSFSKIDYNRMTKRQQKIMDMNNKIYAGCFPTACIRRSLFDRFGAFDLKYSYAEDTEWIARICAAGVDLDHCLYEKLYLRRVHFDQISYSYDEMSKQQYLAIYADAIRKVKKKGTRPC